MNRKLVLLMTWVIVLIGMLVSAAVSVEDSVGVEEGDWIEYKVTVTGTPPTTTTVTWMKIEIQGVEETSVTIKLTMNMSDGTQDTQTTSFDIATGSGGSFFIIPANLASGDTFYVEHYGIIAISKVETRTYVGVSRTVVHSHVTQDDMTATFYWDKPTGVLVEAIAPPQVDYTMNLKADKTNMWQAQPFALPIDPTVFYALIIAAIVIVAAAALLVLRRKKKPPEEVLPPQS